MPYIPKHRFQGNLYTNGGEYVILSNNQPYQGAYYKLSSGKYFTGDTPYNPITQELLPILESNYNTLTNDYLVNNSTIKLGGFGFPNKNITTNYFSIFNIDSNITYLIPQPFVPSPTPEEYSAGTFIRYILFNTITNNYLEVNQSTYENISQQNVAWDYSPYQPFTLPWRISGTQEEIVETNTKMIAVVNQENNLPSLPLYLVNLQEFSKLETPDTPFTVTITYVEPPLPTPVVS